jgi:hypothetical protein
MVQGRTWPSGAALFAQSRWNEAVVGSDVSSALQIRLEQQRHWERATAVKDGEQSGIDPDSHRLIELRTTERVYRADEGTFVKRLSGGFWRIESNLPDVIY